MRPLYLLLLAACGTSSTQTPTQPSGPAASLVAMPAAADDVVVARVNGKPVYGSCVTTQAARGATKQEALAQCVDFELLAQQAAGYASDPEVRTATRTALVSTIVQREYETKFTRPTDFGAFWDRSINANRGSLFHGEGRASAYVRIPIAKTATTDEDARAKAIAEEIAAACAGERGLFAANLNEIAERVTAGRAKVDYAVVPFRVKEGVVPEYGGPLFSIPEVGRTTAAVRTPWGWDVILLTDLAPATNPTPDELAAKVLPDVKRSYFATWVASITQALGATVKYYDDKVPLLEKIE